MSWITIIEADLEARLSGPELAAFRGAALKSGQADPVAPVIRGVIDEIRGYVAGNKANTLGAGETIPSELLDAALALVVARLPARLPVRMTEERLEAKRDAIALLRQVADGKFFVASAATPAADQPGGIELASGDGAYPSATSLNGLI